MENDYWLRFMKTGSVSDYLNYKKYENALKAENDEDCNKGACYKGTDYWGER